MGGVLVGEGAVSLGGTGPEDEAGVASGGVWSSPVDTYTHRTRHTIPALRRERPLARRPMPHSNRVPSPDCTPTIDDQLRTGFEVLLPVGASVEETSSASCDQSANERLP